MMLRFGTRWAFVATCVLTGCPPPPPSTPTGAAADDAAGGPPEEAEAVLPPSDPERAEVEARIRDGGALYRLEPYIVGPECQTWTFRPDDADPTRGLLVREAFTGHHPAEFAYTYALREGGLDLVGPLELSVIPGTFADVGDDPGGVPSVLSWDVLGGRAPAPLDRWFLSEEECATAVGTVETITGLAACDAYLDLYRRCEGMLRAEIQAGNMRPYASEAESLRQLAQTPERQGMPSACQGMTDSLRERCAPPPDR